MDPEYARRDAAAVTAGLASVGFDLDALAAAAGYADRPDRLDVAELGDYFERIWSAAVAARGGDLTFAVEVGDAVPFGAYEVIDYLASSCGTVGAGLREIARYFAIITRKLRWTVDDAHDPPRVFLDPVDAAPLRAILGQQYAIGVTFGRFRRIVDGELAFAGVDLAMPTPADDRLHRAYFGCAVRYEAPRTVLRIPRRVWTLPLSRHEPGLRRILEQHAKGLLAERAKRDDPLAEVRSTLRARLEDRDLKLEAVARALGTSPRTLQRRLGEAGTSLSALVDEERRHAAESYLREPRLAVGDVAYMLGYSEPSAFVRAFKRWTGTTPSAYRQQALR